MINNEKELMEINRRPVGNRRSEEELEALRLEANKTAFELMEQTHFTGTKEQLEMMQTFERAYIDGAPMISDEEWDILKNKYSYEESLVSTSPSGRKWVKMFSPLPSIDKAASLEDLRQFLAKFKSGQTFKVECKLDGLTANVRYAKNDDGVYTLDCIMSKGNGRYGLQLNPHALSGVKKNWPDTIKAKYVADVLECGIENLPKYFELRGEAVVPKNSRTYRKYGKNPVWRSVASGMFNRKVPFNLDGVLLYLYGKSLEQLCAESEDGMVTLKGADARLVASLGNDPDKFLRNDILYIDKYGKISIMHANGNSYSFYDDGEELHIVFYSASIKDSNIDTAAIAEIPGVKYISAIEWEESKAHELKEMNVTYRETDSISEILQAVFDFYGTDENGHRDLSKPRLRNLCEYALDGVVIKPVDSNRETQGMFFRNHKNNPNKIICPKYPEDQIAVKLLSEVVRVKLKSIEYTKTTLGNITCSGVLDKPYLTESGSIVERINLHNPEWLESNSWIKEGEEYDMIMSMDIIPVLLDPNLYH